MPANMHNGIDKLAELTQQIEKDIEEIIEKIPPSILMSSPNTQYLDKAELRIKLKEYIGRE